jgi:hypothetical protein
MMDILEAIKKALETAKQLKGPLHIFSESFGL